MAEAVQPSAGLERHAKLKPVQINELLTRRRIDLGVNVSSKKRLLEKAAALLLKDSPGVDRNTVFQILTERERLGSTGIGNGVALPHGRVNDLDQPIGAVITLATPMDFDAIDGQPVSIVFALLVPAEANQEHLNILAFLAELFSDESLRDKLSDLIDSDEALHLLENWHPAEP